MQDYVQGLLNAVDSELSSDDFDNELLAIEEKVRAEYPGSRADFACVGEFESPGYDAYYYAFVVVDPKGAIHIMEVKREVR